MIPDDVVDRVREEADIISIVGEFVKLKRVGNSFRGPCPFHHGKNDNFSVTPRGYKCFKCGESGNVFTFVEKHLGLDFVEAVKYVGAKTGIEVREVSRNRGDEHDPREPLWEVNATAAEFFRSRLWESPDGNRARDYLASRSIHREDADRFGIGYAPRDPAAMRDALHALGFDDQRLVAAGLLVTREDQPESRARFRDRVLFPIYDASSHVVGFGGRTMGDATPKYLNSAESEIFAKRNLLYGLNWAKQAIRKADRLIIVEGYFDAIRLMLAGINEVVAPLGTALTEQQAALIRKYTKNVYLLYDSDKAGLKATFRSGDVLLANDIAVRVISLPDGEDPDTFVLKHGAEGFERVAAAAVDVFDRKIQILERSGRFADLRKKREAVDKLLPTIRVVSDRLTRDLYISRAADVAGVSREVVLAEARAAKRRAPEEMPWQPDVSAERRTGQQERRRASQPPRSVLLERELVRILLRNYTLIEHSAETISPSDLRVVEYKRIYAALVNSGADVDVGQIANGLDEASVAVLQGLIEANREDLTETEDTETVLAGIIDQMKRASLAREADQLQLELLQAAPDEQDALLRRISTLKRESMASGSRRWAALDRFEPRVNHQQ